jgi:hypothetical protein
MCTSIHLTLFSDVQQRCSTLQPQAMLLKMASPSGHCPIRLSSDPVFPLGRQTLNLVRLNMASRTPKICLPPHLVSLPTVLASLFCLKISLLPHSQDMKSSGPSIRRSHDALVSHLPLHLLPSVFQKQCKRNNSSTSQPSTQINVFLQVHI